jgi:Flp pilus assembly pilin Flp
VLTSSTRRAVVRRSRSLRRDESGAAAVEFALVASLLIILVFGIIEFSLLMRDNIGLSSAARTAARTASAGAGAGACTPTTATCPQALPNAAQDAANAVQRAGLTIPKDSIDELWVFKANPNGFPGNATSMDTASCTSSCIKFRWVDANDKFTYAGGSWDSRQIAACVGTNPDGSPKADGVGVYIKATHKFLLPMFGTTIGMQDRAVMQFEPLANFQCKAGTHP